MNPSSTISSKGQVTIPQEVRQRLGLQEGDRVEFVVEGERTLIRPRSPGAQSLRELRRRAGNLSRRGRGDQRLGSRPARRGDRRGWRVVRTAVDTNVISALWSREPLAGHMSTLLGQAHGAGALVIAAPVYAGTIGASAGAGNFCGAVLA